MNTQITKALSDAELELISGGCYKRGSDDSYGCDDSYDSDDYGCSDEYESKGCEDSYEDSRSCHKRRFRRFRHRHSCSW